jgi:3D (Asp-Asp-Asp) domain-containing protein
VRAAISLALLLLIAAPPAEAARHGRPHRGRVMRMRATAYCQHGKTSDGVRARRGVVAADPRVLPMGTRLRIVGPGRAYAGTYRVVDRGSGVKGREIDIFMPSCREAARFGRRDVDVKVLTE